jgi:hypothetical protein
MHRGCLDHNNVSILALDVVDHHTPFALAPLEFPISAPRDLPAYA